MSRDGDEMNVHVPQSLESQVELKMISAAQYNIISAQSSKPNIAIVQDSLLGAYRMTLGFQKITRSEFYDISEKLELRESVLDRIEHINDIYRKKGVRMDAYCGKGLISLFLPIDLIYEKKNEVNVDEPVVKIYRGVMYEGVLNKDILGSSHNSLIQIINKEYGPETAAHFNAAGSAGFYGAILSQENQKLAQLSLQFFREGVRRYPENAVMAFNLARALWIFGVQEEAGTVFGHLIENHQALTFQASVDGLLSHRVRLLSDMFNYADYYRLATEALRKPAAITAVLSALVSAARTYLALADLLQDQPARALDNLEKAVALDGGNFVAHGLTVETFARLGGREEALLRSFFMAVNLYPPLLLRYGGKGMSAALVLGREDKAVDVMKKCVLLYARTSLADGQPLEISDETKSTMRENRQGLSGWIREIADQLLAEGRL